MQVVILAGGKGTRITEDNSRIPKPLVEIGTIPVLIHLMEYFSSFGHKDFLILLGYKSQEIKRYFLELESRTSDLEIDFKKGEIAKVNKAGKHIDWKVKLIDTGLATMTGGRILKAKKHLAEEFFLTYGDGLSNVDLEALLSLHQKSNTIGTVTAVNPPSRYGAIELDGNRVVSFAEKPNSNSWVNAGFFVFKKSICDFISDSDTIFERSPLEALVKNGELSAYLHQGFWLGMDTLRDRDYLESLWESGQAPWLRT